MLSGANVLTNSFTITSTHSGFKASRPRNSRLSCDEKLLGDDADAAKIVDLKRWIERPGIPKAVIAPTSERLEAIDRLTTCWLSQSVRTGDSSSAEELVTQEWVRFLHQLPA